MTEKEQEQLLALLCIMSLIAGITISHSISVHLKERKKRKQLLNTVQALKEMQEGDAYVNGTKEERAKMVSDFVDIHIPFPKH